MFSLPATSKDIFEKTAPSLFAKVFSSLDCEEKHTVFDDTLNECAAEIKSHENSASSTYERKQQCSAFSMLGKGASNPNVTRLRYWPAPAESGRGRLPNPSAWQLPTPGRRHNRSCRLSRSCPSRHGYLCGGPVFAIAIASP
jgi:hypothetical protein